LSKPKLTKSCRAEEEEEEDIDLYVNVRVGSNLSVGCECCYMKDYFYAAFRFVTLPATDDPKEILTLITCRDEEDGMFG
jgi:hypothetical protein